MRRAWHLPSPPASSQQCRQLASSAAGSLALCLCLCLVACNLWPAEVAAVVALRFLRFRNKEPAQSWSGRRVAMSEEQRRRRRCVVTTSYKVNALTTPPTAPTTPPTNPAPYILTATTRTRTRARTGAAAPTLSKWVAPRPLHDHCMAQNTLMHAL